MKLNLLCAFALLYMLGSSAQFTNFGVEASYPIPAGDNFIGRDYYGIIDLGLSYKFINAGPVKIGAAINGGILKNGSIDDSVAQGVDLTSYSLRPKIIAELNLAALPKLRPSTGLGYSIIYFDVIDNRDGEDETQSGFNFNLGVAYHFTNRFFAKATYDFIKLNLDDDIPDTSFNTNVSIIYIGFGFNI